MKTTEQKAKAYDEAIEKIKEGIKPLQDGKEISGVTKGFLEEVFPELKESEGERIKKAISIYLDWLDGRKDCAPRGEYSIRDMVVWLERQGEQKHGIPELTKQKLNTLLNEALQKETPESWNEFLEQSTAWSEEDEKNLKKAVWYVENPAPNVVKDIMLSEWLKSLKDRYARKL